jgi:hypothetical protein
MENASRAFPQASPLTEGDMSHPLPPKGDPASGPPAVKASSACRVEWDILRTMRVNGLIVGAPNLVAAAVAAFDKSVRKPIVWWTPDHTPDVPEVTAGTLMIRDVDRLDARQQERLSRWIGVHCPRVQVLGLACAPFFTQVVEGRFAAALYYRMNTVIVEVSAPEDLPSPASS